MARSRYLPLWGASLLSLFAFGCDLHFDLDTVLLNDVRGDDARGSDVVDLDVSPRQDGSFAFDATLSDVDGGDGLPADADAFHDGSHPTNDAHPLRDIVEASDVLDPFDVWAEPLCPQDFGIHDAVCHLVQQTGCPSDGYCDLRLVTSPPPRPMCISETHAGTVEEGEPCSGNDPALACRPGHFCVNWPRPDPRGQACSRYCLMSTGEGCGRESFCTYHFADFADIGLCVSRCDPYASESCPEGQICMADSNYPLKTCYPEFRCMLHREEPKVYLSSCVPNGVHQGGGCGPTQTCYPTEEGHLCVRPCQSDEECLDEASRARCEGVECPHPQHCYDGHCVDALVHRCGPPRGDFQLRYCDSIQDSSPL